MGLKVEPGARVVFVDVYKRQTLISRIVYAVVGIAGLYLISTYGRIASAGDR